MKMIKNKLKIILAIVISIVITSVITTYAAYDYFAKDIGYSPSNQNFEVDNVADALNMLYEDINKEIEYQLFDSGGYITTSSFGTFYTQTVPIPQGKTKVYIYSSVSSTWGVDMPTLYSDIISSQNTSLGKVLSINGVIANVTLLSIIETNGNEGNINIDYKCTGEGRHFVQLIVFYK